MKFLENAPNIPKHEIYYELNARGASSHFISFEGKRYKVPMVYVIHRPCGAKIRGLVWKTEYNRLSRVPSHKHGTLENPVRIKVLYCPTCRVRVGKDTRKMLQYHGRLHGWHGPSRERSEIGREEVGCYYVFPRGVVLDPSYTEIVSIDPEHSRCVDDEYDGPYDPLNDF